MGIKYASCLSPKEHIMLKILLHMRKLLKLDIMVSTFIVRGHIELILIVEINFMNKNKRKFNNSMK